MKIIVAAFSFEQNGEYQLVLWREGGMGRQLAGHPAGGTPCVPATLNGNGEATQAGQSAAQCSDKQAWSALRATAPRPCHSDLAVTHGSAESQWAVKSQQQNSFHFYIPPINKFHLR